jgi:hypothetical protein
MQDCGRADARARLRHAELYLSLAQTVLADDGGDQATVAAGNAVLAAIAAGDAICCAAGGARYRGPDHRRAAEQLERITGDKQLASLLREVVDLKDAGHYGLSDIATSRGKSAVRKAEQLVSAARARVR